MGKRSKRTTTASRRGAFAEGTGAGARALIGDCGLMRSRDVARGRPGGSSASTLSGFMGCLSLRSRTVRLAPAADSRPYKKRESLQRPGSEFQVITRSGPQFFLERGFAVWRAPRRSVRALHCRDEEAVGAVIARRHQQRLVRAVGGRHGRLGRKRSLPQLGPRNELELRVAGEKILHLVAVLRRQNRTGDIGDAPARLDEVSALFEHGLLLVAPRLKHRRRKAPFGIGAPPPDARTRAWRIDQDEIHLARELGEALALAWGQHLNVPHPCSLQPLEDRPKAERIGIVSVELTRILHQRRERQGLAASARAKIDDLLARACAGKQRRELRALVLNLVPAFAVTGLRLEMRIAGRPRTLRDADPKGRERRRRWLETPQRL